MAYLSSMDVKALAEKPSLQARRQLAGKVAMDYCLGHFSEAEAAIAEEIFRLLARDDDQDVRSVLAEQLAHCATVPRDIIFCLAADEASIAAPVLEYSPVLTENDLVAIIKSSREGEKLLAIARRADISVELLSLLKAHSEQRRMFQDYSGYSDDDELENLVEQLYMEGRLTHSLLVRALCKGNLGVFEAGMARLAGVPRVHARMIMLGGGASGFDALYGVSGLPEGFMDAIRVLLQISLEETEYGYARPADFRKRVVDRMYAAGYNKSIENMEYMLAIIGGKIAAAA